MENISKYFNLGTSIKTLLEYYFVIVQTSNHKNVSISPNCFIAPKFNSLLIMDICWGYNHHNGPSEWSKMYPVADEGVRQSPVNIQTENAVPAGIPELLYKYEPANVKIVNTGSSWKMDFETDVSNLSGGPLEDKYKIWQMHAHWGKSGGKGGSEHTIDGSQYDAELHIVHYNDKYENPTLAAAQPDGLAVLGMFLKAGKAHEELDKICRNLTDVQTKDKSVVKDEDWIDPSQFLPGSKTFFTYPGSLTTPPLYESVTWIVFKEPVEVSEEQLETMRSLKFGEEESEEYMVDNFRPPCDLKGRTIRVKTVDKNDKYLRTAGL